MYSKTIQATRRLVQVAGVYSACFNNINKNMAVLKVDIRQSSNYNKRIIDKTDDSVYKNQNNSENTDKLGEIITLANFDVHKPTNSKRSRPTAELGDESSEKMDLSGLPKFKTLDEDSNILGKAITQVRSRKRREKNNLILLEGKRLIQDAILAGAEPLQVFFSRPSDLRRLEVTLSPKTKLYRVGYKQLQYWSDVSTSQGILGIFKEPETAVVADSSNCLPLTVVCDNVRDPGNLGSILRTAASVGCRRLVLTNGCVDLWEPKVIRSASGAHFRIPIYKSIDWDDMNSILEPNSSVYLADSNRLLKDCVEEEEEDLEEVVQYEVDEAGNKVIVKERKEKKSQVFQKTATNDLVLREYGDVSYGLQKDLVVVVGGETEGLSGGALRYGAAARGCRIHIPLCNNVDSLNSGTALGIIVYEIKRQVSLLARKLDSDSDCIYQVGKSSYFAE